ncbi:MAG: GNAT family N-acetyltransferase [Solirubrobacterales bacterium]|nr:GNAT family N-acetyltransferase [Solirubrobacterales bacterium]
MFDEAPAVLAVLTARDLADLGAPDYTLSDLRDEWGLSDLDLATDAVVAEAPNGKIAGYAIVRRPGTLAVVAPEHEGQGIGTKLLRWSEQRAREQGRPRYRQWIAANNDRARELLVGAGYEHRRSYWRMTRVLDAASSLSRRDAPEAPDLPSGYRHRTLDVARDGETVHALDDICFAGSSDHEPGPFEAFADEHLRAHDFDPTASLVIERGDELAGYLLARRWRGESVGFVDLLGVHPQHRGRGIGTWLLLSSFARFAAAGLREVQLGVASDNPRALRIYERAGMHPRFRSDIYERPAEAPDAR